MRKLVTIRKITDILPITDADRIIEVVVDGWSIVAQKGIHSVGNDVLYFEIDSFLPESDTRYESFLKFGTRTFEGAVGHRVKTKRMKGVYSQGIIMPVSEFPEITNPEYDVDYSELLGIAKWEAPEITAGSGKQGDAKGNFPCFLQKSDQERIQNLYGKYSRVYSDAWFVGTLKLDGSSCTVSYVEGDRYENKGNIICSRNLELKYDPELPFEEQGIFVKGAINSGLFAKAKQLHEVYGGYYAIQGELVGAGIQKSFEKFTEYEVFAYNIWDIEKGEFVNYNSFVEMANIVSLQIVPEVYQAQQILKEDLKTILEMANGQGLRAAYREGLVWRQIDGQISFKAISNRYLDKEE